MKLLKTLGLVVLSSTLFAVEKPVNQSEEEFSLKQMRMSKRFGVGFSAGGPLAILGMEVDINVSENFSIGGGIGTGLDYSTFMVKGRYFLLGETVSPYIGAGFARWRAEAATPGRLSPGILPDQFLSPTDNLVDGFEVLLVYPVLGVQFMHAMGMAFFAEGQYLFKLFDFSNAVYAGLGVHWYF